MLNCEFQRSMAGVTLVAAVSMASGCATTQSYLVDPDATSRLVVTAVKIGDQRTHEFGTAGGVYDPGAQVFRGLDDEGRSVSYPLAKVSRVTLRPQVGASQEFMEFTKGLPGALQQGVAWRPGGRVQFVVKSTGEVLDLRQLKSRVDASARLVRYTPKIGSPVDIPFADINYLQMRETHPWRATMFVLGAGLMAGCLAFAIAVSNYTGLN